MNVEALHVALQRSFDSDAQIRIPAEQFIQNLKNVPGATVMLLQVAAEKQVAFEVRQAAAIQLKNLCRECWAGGPRVGFGMMGAGPIVPGMSPTSTTGGKAVTLLSEEDKNGVKEGLVTALLREDRDSLRDLLVETLHVVAVHDYPERWPILLDCLLEAVSSERGALEVHNALVALRKICKRYEYKAAEARGPLNEIVLRLFPLLLPLAQKLVAGHHSRSGSSERDDDGQMAAMMLTQSLKIFWSATQFYLPEAFAGWANVTVKSPSSTDVNVNVTSSPSSPLGSVEAVSPWFDLMSTVTGNPGGHPPPEGSAWWKVKKWSLQIMSRLFSRYGIPAYASAGDGDGGAAVQFAKFFSAHVAPAYLGPVLETLSIRPSGAFCTDRVVHLALTYVDSAVELATTYRLLKPHLDVLLYRVCFPTLCLSEDDIETFEADPHEFVRRQNSPLADFFDPRMSAVTLVENLVKNRAKDVAEPLLEFLGRALRRYRDVPPSNRTARDHLEKDGALFALGSLSESSLKKKKYAPFVEEILIHSVFPDFTSEIGYLRCRACWMASRFSSLRWSAPSPLMGGGTGTANDGQQQQLQQQHPLVIMTRHILERLSDPALPTRIEASKALRYLIEVDGTENTILPVLPVVLEQYFRIMVEIGNDEVVAALQCIIDRFGGERIEPHAVALIERLSEAFAAYVSVGEEDEDAAMAAAQCLECIATVLKGTCDRPDLYKRMYPRLVPLVMQILGNDGDYVEYLEYALDILTFVTYFPDDLEPALWEAFPLIYVAWDQWAFDYLTAMVPPLENFIGKAPRHFATSGPVTLPLPASATASSVSPSPQSSQSQLQPSQQQQQQQQQQSITQMTYMDMVDNVVRRTVTDDRTTANERRRALSLHMTVLHCCPGLVDDRLPAIHDLALGVLERQADARTPLTRISALCVIGSSFYYNPLLTLHDLEQRSPDGSGAVTRRVVAQWLADSKKMDQWLPRKLFVLGLGSLLRLPTAALPAHVAQGLPQLIAEVVHMSHSMKEDAEVHYTDEDEDEDDNDIDADDNPNAHAHGHGNQRRQAGRGGVAVDDVDLDDDDDDDEDGLSTDKNNEENDENFEGYDETQDVVSPSNLEYMSVLHKIGKIQGDKATDKALAGELWDDDFDDDDDDNYSSPLDDIDQLLFVNDAMQEAFQREPAVYQQVQAAMTPEALAACQKLFQLAEEQRRSAAVAAAGAVAQTQ